MYKYTQQFDKEARHNRPKHRAAAAAPLLTSSFTAILSFTSSSFTSITETYLKNKPKRRKEVTLQNMFLKNNLSYKYQHLIFVFK